MLLGKVGNKSIAFINHKPFHPGNLQNIEKVWQAEERAAQEEKKQKELLERRKHEVQIEELRKALRRKEEQQQSQNGLGPRLITSARPQGDEAAGSQRRKRPRNHGGGNNLNARKLRMVEENPNSLQAGCKANALKHAAVWGSYFDRSSMKWGYSCCSQTDYTSVCSLTISQNPS